MAKWKSPIYGIPTGGKKVIEIDVTTSISPGLPAHRALNGQIANFKALGVKSVLDFGAGVLRHSIPLLDAGLDVCAVEFEQAFQRDIGLERRTDVEARYPNFSKLIWPCEFKKDDRKFGLALLCFVLQTMPLKEEREDVLRLMKKKLKWPGLVLYMSRVGLKKLLPHERAILDGHYMYPDRKVHSFYTEWSANETKNMFSKHKLNLVQNYSEGGSEHVYLFELENKYFDR